MQIYKYSNYKQIFFKKKRGRPQFEVSLASLFSVIYYFEIHFVRSWKNRLLSLLLDNIIPI